MCPKEVCDMEKCHYSGKYIFYRNRCCRHNTIMIANALCWTYMAVSFQFSSINDSVGTSETYSSMTWHNNYAVPCIIITRSQFTSNTFSVLLFCWNLIWAIITVLLYSSNITKSTPAYSKRAHTSSFWTSRLISWTKQCQEWEMVTIVEMSTDFTRLIKTSRSVIHIIQQVNRLVMELECLKES